MDLALCSHKKGSSLTWSSAPLWTKTIVSNSAANQTLTGYVMFIVLCSGNAKLSTTMRCFLWVYIFKSTGTIQIKSFFLFIRDLRLSCRGSGVHPPLELSHSLVRFRDTAVSDCSSAVVFLTNHEAMRERMTPVPPRLFTFAVPSDGEISISPAGGRLQPGQVDSLD